MSSQKNTYGISGLERPKNLNLSYWEKQVIKLPFGEENKVEYNLNKYTKSSSNYSNGNNSKYENSSSGYKSKK